MSLQAKILNLIGGIKDPSVRIDVASTINYLFSLYCSGTVREDEIRRSLLEVCMDVITVTYPDLTLEEIRKKSEVLVDEFIKAFRVESTVRRMFSRFRSRTVPPI